MTTAADSPEAAGPEGREPDEQTFDLLSQIKDLRDQLAEVRCFTPYDHPADVLAVLAVLLSGWPTRRWNELADLIEQQAILGRRAS